MRVSQAICEVSLKKRGEYICYGQALEETTHLKQPN
jgi:hypothetical protein